jgi:hypothetical protein
LQGFLLQVEISGHSRTFLAELQQAVVFTSTVAVLAKFVALQGGCD